MDKDKAIKEIKQLKELLDSEILTQNEYDAKSADLKKIILDSENKKIEPSESKKEKEFWLQKAIEKSNNEKEIIPPKKEEIKPNKQLVDKDEVVLKETTDELSNDSNKKDTIKTSGGFRKWLNKKESPLNNFLYIALGFIVIPTNFFVFMTFSDYIIGFANGSSTYGDYPFDSNYVYLFIWLVIGTPFILFFSYLISLIKSLKVKTTKVFFLFTLFFLLVFLRSFQTTIYPVLTKPELINVIKGVFVVLGIILIIIWIMNTENVTEKEVSKVQVDDSNSSFKIDSSDEEKNINKGYEMGCAGIITLIIIIFIIYVVVTVK